MKIISCSMSSISVLMSWRYASVAVETTGGWDGGGAAGDGGGVADGADGADGPEPHTPSSSHLCFSHHAQQRLSNLAGSS